MNPSAPKKGILLIADDKPNPLSSPEEPDQDDPQQTSGNETCSTCYAYRPSDGRCQMYPPHGMEWAQVEADEYCCQYRPGKQHDSGNAQPQPGNQTGSLGTPQSVGQAGSPLQSLRRPNGGNLS